MSFSNIQKADVDTYFTLKTVTSLIQIYTVFNFKCLFSLSNNEIAVLTPTQLLLFLNQIKCKSDI